MSEEQTARPGIFDGFVGAGDRFSIAMRRKFVKLGHQLPFWVADATDSFFTFLLASRFRADALLCSGVRLA